MANVELRQLRYFLAVAEELNFGRAAERLLIAGPSLSQQIKALERDLGVRLFDRDRRSVALSPAGAALLPHTRALLERADDLQSRAARMSGSEPVRLGYVNWLPADLTARTSAVAQLHIDAWIAPSHTQAARVAGGSLDLAVCWVRTQDLEQHGLNARLIGADRLYAVATGADTSDVRSHDTAVLLDDDTTSWSSWNAYAEQLARDTGACAVRISDGGITGSAFFDHPAAARSGPAPTDRTGGLLDLVFGLAPRRSPRRRPGRRRRPHRRHRRPRNPPAGRLAPRRRPTQAVGVPHISRPRPEDCGPTAQDTSRRIPPLHPEEHHEMLGGLQPVGRMGEVSDIVDAVIYLENAPFVTGEILHVDGGQSAGH
jgi:DNA-binding transcriptional LysR family regulator